MNLLEIVTTEDFHAAYQASSHDAVLILKHSTRCPISGNAYREFRQFCEAQTGDGLKCYIVKVIENRPTSNEITVRTGIEHASPQVLLLIHQKPIWTASHRSITQSQLEKAIKEFCEKH